MHNLSFFLILSIFFIGPVVHEPSAYVAFEDTKFMTETAQKVLNDLKAAKGILPHEPPHLVVKQFTGSQKIAVLYQDKGILELDELTYRICRGMGQDSLNALAFILGHELGHFIHRHGSINHNIQEAAPGLVNAPAVIRIIEEADTVSRVNHFNQRLTKAVEDYQDTHDEAEADFEGGFLGFLAGYEPMNAGKEFFKRAYNHPFMGLRSTIPGYPTLDQRLDIVEKTGEDLAALIPFFDISTYLMAIEQYEDAIPYLEKILRKFESREIYNNIGVLYLMETLRLFEEPVTRYLFPLTLDVDFRAPHPQFFETYMSASMGERLLVTDLGYCQLSNAQKQIEESEKYFKKAIYLDEDYVVGYLNLSVAQSIKAILYDNNEDLDLYSRICFGEKSEEFSKALASAYLAKSLAVKALDEVSVRYYDVMPSDSITLGVFPDPWDLSSMSDRTDTIDLIRPNAFNIIYPYKEELFNQKVRIKGSNVRNSPPKMSRYTIWNTPDDNIPDEAILLSNIEMQIDLIKVLNEEVENGLLEFSGRLPGTYRVVPFTRALEIHPQNKLAGYNRSLFSGDLNPMPANTQWDLCDPEIRVGGKTLVDIYNSTIAWELDDKIEKSRLVAYYPSGDFIMDRDLGIIKRGFFRSQQIMKFAEKDKYSLYSNRTELAVGRTEESLFIVPKSTEGLSVDCGVIAGKNAAFLLSNFGPPFKSVNLNKGRFLIYKTRKVSENSGVINAPVFFGSSKPKLPPIENRENGVIFKLDGRDTIKSWIGFHLYVKTEPKEID